MALSKEKVSHSGSLGSYWKIINEAYDKRNLKARANLGLFVDKVCSDGGLDALEVKKFYFEGLTKPELQGNRTALLYDKIKASEDPDLINAEDA